MAAMKPVFIFDIDGVLADNSRTKHLDCTRAEQAAEFARLAAQVKVLKTAELVRKLAAAAPVYLFTARSAGIRTLTQNWLYDHRVPHEDLFMRPFGNDDGAPELKRRMLDELMLRTGARPQDICACDDDPGVREMYLRAGVSVLVPGRETLS